MGNNELWSVLKDSGYKCDCCDDLFGIKEYEFIHLKLTYTFHVKTVLLCIMEIESPFYQAKQTIIPPPICSNCGMNNGFVDENIISEETNDRKTRPLCIKCNKEVKNRLSLEGSRPLN